MPLTKRPQKRRVRTGLIICMHFVSQCMPHKRQLTPSSITTSTSPTHQKAECFANLVPLPNQRGASSHHNPFSSPWIGVWIMFGENGHWLRYGNPLRTMTLSTPEYDPPLENKFLDSLASERNKERQAIIFASICCSIYPVLNAIT